ncbi:MAG: DUF3883 domain-containing protein [Bacilli bacterium]|nr:DUF3883 domain-containing protein [Bacilli bacterium]
MNYDVEEKRKDFTYRENSEIDFSFRKIKNELEEADIQPYFIMNRFREHDKDGVKLVHDYIMAEYDLSDFISNFETKIINFFDVLFEDEFPLRFTRILMEISYPYDLIDHCYRAIVNIIYAYDNLDIYDDDVKLLQTIISQTKSKYKNVSEEDIKRQFKKYGYGDGEEEFKFANMCTLYPSFLNDIKYEGVEKRDEQVHNNIRYLDTFTSDQFFTFSEYRTYLLEKAYLKKLGLENRVRWVSRYDGDSMHYDILSYDPEKDEEKIIEVKSTVVGSSTFSLSECEMNTFKNSNDVLRYVYWFRISDYLDKQKKIISKNGKIHEMFILKYVSNDDIGFFVDQNGTRYDIDLWINQDGKKCYGVYDTNKLFTEKGKIFSKKFAETISFK